MATYLPNVTDIIPESKPFTPNFEFYNQVLQIKNSQYQQGYKKLSNLYGSALNSELTRPGNIERRDKYFKDIEQEIKKISGLDLSLPQNVAAAADVFKPFYEDKDIQLDWGITKTYRNADSVHKMLKNCVGDDCNDGEAWDIGKRAIDYKIQEFKNASIEDSRNFGKIEYTPYVKYADDVLKFMKDNKIEITQEERAGRYNITTTNGPLLEGPLYNMIKTLFGNDPKLTEMYKTKAYVERKDYSYSRAQEFGGDFDAAEKEYLIEKAGTISNTIDTQLDQIDNQLEIYNSQLTALTKKNNLNSNQREQLSQLEMAIPLLEKSKESLTTARDNYSNLNDVDLKTIRSRVDGIVASTMFDSDIKGMAKDFSKIGYTKKFEADPYSLASFQNSLNFSTQVAMHKMKTKSEWDMFVAKKEFEYKLEKAKEQELAGLNDKLNIIAGEPDRENVEKVNTHTFNMKTMNDNNNELRELTKTELNKVYNYLSANKETALLKQIFKSSDGTLSSDNWSTWSSRTYAPQFVEVYRNAQKVLNNHATHKSILSGSVNQNAQINFAIQNYNAATVINRQNNLKVKNALIANDDISAEEAKTFFKDNGDVISKVDYIKKGGDEDDYDDFMETFVEQYANPEAPTAYRTKLFVGSQFADKSGAVGVRPGTVSVDPLKYLSPAYGLASSMLQNIASAGDFNGDEDAQRIFNQFYRDFNTRLDPKKENEDRASASIKYEAISDKEGHAKVTLMPNAKWLEDNVFGGDKTGDDAQLSKYSKGIEMYIPNDKVHNAFDTEIKNFGDLIFEANNNAVSFGDNNNPENGGYVNLTRNGNQYTTTSRLVRLNKKTGEWEFTPVVTSSGYNLDPENLIQETLTLIENNRSNIIQSIEEMNNNLNTANAQLTNRAQ